MKAELRFVEHTQLPGQMLIEVWHEGKLIGTVVGADGPGIRFISKHEFEPAKWEPGIRFQHLPPAHDRDSMVVELRVKPGTLNGEARDLGMKA